MQWCYLKVRKETAITFYAQREIALGLVSCCRQTARNQERQHEHRIGRFYKEANMGLVGRLGYDFKTNIWLSSVSVMTVLQNLQVDINGDSSHLYPEDGVSLKKASGKIPNSISLII